MGLSVILIIRCDREGCYEFIQLRNCPDLKVALDEVSWTIKGFYTESPLHLCSLHATGLCRKKLGTKPSWMSADQYDPCLCLLTWDHENACVCSCATS